MSLNLLTGIFLLLANFLPIDQASRANNPHTITQPTELMTFLDGLQLYGYAIQDIPDEDTSRLFSELSQINILFVLTGRDFLVEPEAQDYLYKKIQRATGNNFTLFDWSTRNHSYYSSNDAEASFYELYQWIQEVTTNTSESIKVMPNVSLKPDKFGPRPHPPRNEKT